MTQKCVLSNAMMLKYVMAKYVTIADPMKTGEPGEIARARTQDGWRPTGSGARPESPQSTGIRIP